MRFITTGAFPIPEWTQVPNRFFEMLPEMEASEISVTLIMIRNTYGFHCGNFKMGINKIAAATGLSRNAVKAGAEAAEKRGTFRRTNPENQTEAEWELIIDQPVTMVTECPGDGQPVTNPGSMNDPQVGIKEIKEIIKKESTPDFENMTVQQAWKVPSLKLYHKATRFWPGSILWVFIHEQITKNHITEERLRHVAQEWAGRGYKSENVKGILEWAVNGIPVNGRGNDSAPSAPPRNPFAALERMLQEQEKHESDQNHQTINA